MEKITSGKWLASETAMPTVSTDKGSMYCCSVCRTESNDNKVIAKCYGATADEARANAILMAASKNLLESLEKAVEVIKFWHNFTNPEQMSSEAADHIWNIYYKQSPEMKIIRETIESLTTNH